MTGTHLLPSQRHKSRQETQAHFTLLPEPRLDSSCVVWGPRLPTQGKANRQADGATTGLGTSRPGAHAFALRGGGRDTDPGEP